MTDWKKITPLQQQRLDQIKELHTQGLTKKEIETKMNLSHSTFYWLLKHAGLNKKIAKPTVIVHENEIKPRKGYTRKQPVDDKCMVIITNASSLKDIMNEIL